MKKTSALWKCASITTNQASRVMKAAAAAFFIGTGAANRKRQQAETLTHTRIQRPLSADVHNMRRLRAKKRPLSSIVARKYFNYSQTTTTRGKGSNFISARRHAWPNEMLCIHISPFGMVYFMVQREKDARLEWEDKKLRLLYYALGLEEKCHSPGLSLNRINNAERAHAFLADALNAKLVLVLRSLCLICSTYAGLNRSALSTEKWMCVCVSARTYMFYY